MYIICFDDCVFPANHNASGRFGNKVDDNMRMTMETILIILSISGIALILGVYYNIKDTIDVDYYSTEQYIDNPETLIVINRVSLLTDKCFKKYEQLIGKHLCYQIYVSTSKAIEREMLDYNIDNKDFDIIYVLKNNVIDKTDLLNLYYFKNSTGQGVIIYSGLN